VLKALDRCGVFFDCFRIVALRARERMVHGTPFLFSRKPFKHRKFSQPRGFAILSDKFSKPLLNPASHVAFRSYAVYENELKKAGFIVLDTLPMFYFLNRTFIPIIGPRLLSTIKAGKFLYHIDTTLRNRRLWNWNGSKLLLAQKLDI